MLLHDGATVVRPRDGVDRLAAMSLACAGTTVVHALRDRLPIRLGETVIVQGSGPVGLAAAAPSRLAGAVKVIVVGGPERRLRLARECGSGDEHLNVVDAGDPEPVLRHAVELAGGGADTVIECAGVPAAVAQGLRLVRRGGSYLVIGQYTDAGDAASTCTRSSTGSSTSSDRGHSPARTSWSTSNCCPHSPSASTSPAW